MSPLAAPPGALPPLPEWPELTPAAQAVGGSQDKASHAGSPAGLPAVSLAASAAASVDDGSSAAAVDTVTVDDIFGPVQSLSREEEPAAAAANAAAKRAAPKVSLGTYCSCCCSCVPAARIRRSFAAAIEQACLACPRKQGNSYNPNIDQTQVTNAQAALSALMDNPHPFDILGDPAAYGPEGAISRYHNPDNYTASLGGAPLVALKSFCAWVAPQGLPLAGGLAARETYHQQSAQPPSVLDCL